MFETESFLLLAMTATITDICGWVKNAWEEISKEIIFDSFKKCRISSALNGSEDKVKFPTVDPIIKEIKADDAVQRSQSQNDEFNREYTIETDAEEASQWSCHDRNIY